MKLGIVSDEQFALEISRTPAVSSNDSRASDSVAGLARVEQSVKRGRPEGSKEVPEILRKLIADEHLTNGRKNALELAQDWGISSSSVSAYANGATSTTTYHKPDQTISNYLKSRKQKISKKALRVLTNSLDQLTPEKLQGIKARDLAAIAKDMSTVSNNMTPDSDSASSNKPQFVIYAPQVRDERSYETIVVQDNY